LFFRFGHAHTATSNGGHGFFKKKHESMPTDRFKKKLQLVLNTLRNDVLVVEKLLSEIEKISPTNPKPKIRRNLKDERFNKFYNKISGR
jgi:hypothetical protein